MRIKISTMSIVRISMVVLAMNMTIPMTEGVSSNFSRQVDEGIGVVNSAEFSNLYVGASILHSTQRIEVQENNGTPIVEFIDQEERIVGKSMKGIRVCLDLK